MSTDSLTSVTIFDVSADPLDKFFIDTDALVEHWTDVVSGVANDHIKSRYAGFVAVAGVTSYEVAIRDIIIEFSEKKHEILGNFSRSLFSRMSGKISYEDLWKNHLSKFGQKYVEKFKKSVSDEDNRIVREHRTGLIAAYSNMILWRNSFAHSGNLSANATFNEAVKSYNIGKGVVRCLAKAMHR